MKFSNPGAKAPMYSSRKRAESFITAFICHENPDWRAVYLRMLVLNWSPTSALKEHYEAAAWAQLEQDNG